MTLLSRAAWGAGILSPEKKKGAFLSSSPIQKLLSDLRDLQGSGSCQDGPMISSTYLFVASTVSSERSAYRIAAVFFANLNDASIPVLSWK
jgi:hypothetical protein